jgi:hypothetical protein
VWLKYRIKNKTFPLLREWRSPFGVFFCRSRANNQDWCKWRISIGVFGNNSTGDTNVGGGMF